MRDGDIIELLSEQGVLPSLTHSPASNTPATRTTALTIHPDHYAFIARVRCSYDSAPTGGMLRIYERNAGNSADETLLYTDYVTAAGPAPLDCLVKANTPGRQLRAELAAGGSGVSGTINVFAGVK